LNVPGVAKDAVSLMDLFGTLGEYFPGTCGAKMEPKQIKWNKGTPQ